MPSNEVNPSGGKIQKLKADNDKESLTTNRTNHVNEGTGTAKGRIHSIFRSSLMTVNTSSSDKSRKKEESKNEDVKQKSNKF